MSIDTENISSDHIPSVLYAGFGPPLATLYKAVYTPGAGNPQSFSHCNRLKTLRMKISLLLDIQQSKIYIQLHRV